MSTFSGTINAAAAYLVNDIYKRYMRPDASDREYIYASYAASVLLVVVGCTAGYFARRVFTGRRTGLCPACGAATRAAMF